jgi:hypothetical protein
VCFDCLLQVREFYVPLLLALRLSLVALLSFSSAASGLFWLVWSPGRPESRPDRVQVAQGVASRMQARFLLPSWIGALFGGLSRLLKL